MMTATKRFNICNIKIIVKKYKITRNSRWIYFLLHTEAWQEPKILLKQLMRRDNIVLNNKFYSLPHTQGYTFLDRWI